MRLFVALDLPAAVRQPLAAWRPDVPGARWTPAERLHLTLRFLGETLESLTNAITDQICALEGPPVPIETAGLIALPTAHRPRALAVRVAETPELTGLHARLEAVLAEVGVATAERPLLPHITLARFRPSGGAALRRVLWTAAPPRAAGVASSVSLVHSRSGEDGSRYQALCRARL